MKTNNRFPIVQLENLSKTFRQNDHFTNAVCDVSLQVYPGELILLLGPSGSGKTTLLTLIAGFIQPSAGKVRLFGQDLQTYGKRDLQKLRAGKVGFVFQNFLLIDALSVLQNIVLVQEFLGTSRSAAKKKALALLAQLDIAKLAGRFPKQLSQGEKQRVAIARALANNAGLIIADEPTANLESTQGFEIIQLLHRLTKSHGKSVIVASHDQRMISVADRVLYIEDGAIRPGKASAQMSLQR